MRFLRLIALLAVALMVVPAAANAYEVHISITGAGQVTETTSANLVGSGCVTSANNPTGTVGVNCYPGDPTGTYSWGWDVDYVATAKPGYRFVQWQSDGSATPGVICNRSNPPASATTYTGGTCKFTTYDNLQTRAVFVDDTAPSMSSLAGPNQAVNGATSFTFSATADPTLSGFECRVVGVHDWVTCTSGRSENPASSGDYTFEVRAVDSSGNVSAVSTWGWTVDKIAPETSLFVGPTDGTFTSNTGTTFEFSSNESGDFLCSLDSVQATCGSPKSYTGLAEGQHTFTVKARDVAGNVDGSASSRSWTVDTTDPVVEISTPEEGALLASNDLAPDITATDANMASVVCKVDSVVTPCTGVSGLDDGSHVFSVDATDKAGNSAGATSSFTVDTVAPNTKFKPGGVPPAKTKSSRATFKFTSTEDGSTFQCKLDRGAWKDCSSPKTYKGLSRGKHTVRVRAIDAAKNRDGSPAVRTWRRT